MPDGGGLGALEVRVRRHRRLRLGLRVAEDRVGEFEHAHAGLEARVRDVEAERRSDLVVPRAAGVDLRPTSPSSRSIAEWTSSSDSSTSAGEIAASRSSTSASSASAQQSGRVQPGRVDERRGDVVGRSSRVVGLEEVPRIRVQPALDPARPERHGTATSLRSRAAASSVSIAARRMKPSAAACGNVSPTPYEASSCA